MSSTTRKLSIAMLLAILAVRGYALEPQDHFKQIREQMKAAIDQMFSDDFFSGDSIGKIGNFGNLGNLGGEAISIKVDEDKDYQYYSISGQGIDPADLDININKGRVTIKAQGKTEEKNSRDDSDMHSISSFSFVQSFGIPENLDSSRAEVYEEDGKSVIKFPKIGIKGGIEPKSDNVI
jgi:HSP20 family molecular chaperone IbpA